jgi:hypothetical protein
LLPFVFLNPDFSKGYVPQLHMQLAADAEGASLPESYQLSLPDRYVAI